MQYLKYTYVDSRTGVAITDAPAANGPMPPFVSGLAFDFALESQYPTNVPIFFGTAPDEADVIVSGVIDVIDYAAYESARTTELAARADLAATREAEARARMTVSRFQARAALHLAGLLEQVETLMQSPETDMLARLAWQDAQEFKRQSPTVLAMSAALNLTDAQIDELFITAAGIEA